ncbi:MAG TPA: hypothetical protein VK206_09555 [Anaerolineales bacterium]|nr:hypothetical protein [Anaerolineales bacterium]
MTAKKQNPTESNESSLQNDGGVYELIIKGLLDDHWQQWFEGMTLKRKESEEAGQDSTLIRGRIVDQPALHGLLAKIRDLNLTLLSVRKIATSDLGDQEQDQNHE